MQAEAAVAEQPITPAGDRTPDVPLIQRQAAASGLTSLLTGPRTRQIISDLCDSVKESPRHAPEILSEVWDSIKEHWIVFTATLVGFLAAEIIVGILTALPEPTLITKIVAVVLQALIIAGMVVFAGVELKATFDEAILWWRQASKANGDPKQISEASRSFCRMVLHLLIAILNLAGARARIRGFKAPAGRVPEPMERPAPVPRSLPPNEMGNLLLRIWSSNPILQRLAALRAMSGAAMRQALLDLLGDFEAQTGIKVRFVEEGVVQAVRGKGNFASLRSRPGYFEIEKQVLDNPAQFWTEVAHELAFYFAGGPGKVPAWGESGINAMELLEMMIQSGPQSVLKMLGVEMPKPSTPPPIVPGGAVPSHTKKSE